MRNIIKNIVETNPYYFRVVDSTYVVTPDEEYVVDINIAEYLYNMDRMDYIQLRTYIQYYICNDDNWALMSTDERLIAVSHYCKNDDVIWDDLIDEPNLKTYWIEVVKKEQDSRAHRVSEGLALISWTLTKPEAMDLFMTMQDYIYSYQMADLPMLYWYTNDTVIPGVIDFSTTGFSSKPYYSIEKRDLINSIIIR